MKDILSNQDGAALTVFNGNQGDKEKLLCKLRSCNRAAQRQKIAISNKIDDHKTQARIKQRKLEQPLASLVQDLKTQVRIEQERIASLEEDCTTYMSE